MTTTEWRKLNRYISFMIGGFFIIVIILSVLGAKVGSFHIISLESGFWEGAYDSTWMGIVGFGGFLLGNIARTKLIETKTEGQ